jgi:hypothetical protein
MRAIGDRHEVEGVSGAKLLMLLLSICVSRLGISVMRVSRLIKNLTWEEYVRDLTYHIQRRTTIDYLIISFSKIAFFMLKMDTIVSNFGLCG